MLYPPFWRGGYSKGAHLKAPGNLSPQEATNESMTRTLPTLVRAVLFTVLIGPFAAVAAPQIGQPAPDFTATDSKGSAVSLRELRGKTVVLEWTNADCPYTRKHYSSGNMQSLQALAQKNGVVWLTVISSAPGKQGYVNGPAADGLTQSRGAV